MLLPDTILAQRYRILQAIKSGGAGQVYQAFDQRLQVQVAIKQLMAEHMAQAFVREAQLLAHLQHPALPRVSDYFSEAGADFVVMDFIPGPDLSDLIRQHGAPFAPADVVDWGVQLLDALEYLHTHTPPILHRDIKPHNLKLTANKRLMLLDFGLAKGSPLAEHMTTHSVAGYTPDYAPLEQIHGAGTTEQSDLYAVGATLYHLLTQQRAANALARANALVQQQSDPFIPAHVLNPQVPLALSTLLAQTMALNPQQRPHSAAAMRQALAASLAPPISPDAAAPTQLYVPAQAVGVGDQLKRSFNQPPSLTTPNVPLQSSAGSLPATAQRRLLLVLALVGVLLLAAAGGWFYTRDSAPVVAGAATTTPAQTERSTSTTRPTATLVASQPTITPVQPTITPAQPTSTLAQPTATLQASPTGVPVPSAPVIAAADIAAFYDPAASYGVMVYDINTQTSPYAHNANTLMPAASLIKVPLVLAVFDRVRQGELELEQLITVQAADIVGGTGTLQFEAPGSSFTLRELLRLLIVESDNTAGNILIRLLGIDAINNYLRINLDLRGTSFGRLFMDFEAQAAGFENMTTAADMGIILWQIHQAYAANDPLLSELWEWLSEVDDPKIATALPPDVTVVHKTGVLEGVEHDAAIVYSEDEPYILVVLSDNLPTQQAGLDTITNISLAVYIAYVLN